MNDLADSIQRRIDDEADELVELCRELIRIPTVNPPGELYPDCAYHLGAYLERCDFEVEYPVAEERPEHSERYPRINVLGRRRGGAARPCVHLNGHFDVVPAGEGWTTEPFGAEVRDGKLYGRGSADMKAGLAAAIFAAEALRRCGAEPRGSIEVSGTVDEESGGFAGVAHLAAQKLVSAETTDHVIIPEPFSPHRICVGHRGVYWFDVVCMGHIAHGSMPWLGHNAIDAAGVVLERFRRELKPAIAERMTVMPVEPPEAKRGSLNVNAILGGQAGEDPQTPCVADRCTITFDRRFLIEEGFDETKREIDTLLESCRADLTDFAIESRELMVVHPTQTPEGSLLVAALQASIGEITGREAEIVASPGTYDQKHFARIAGVEDCVAYGPGTLEQAHQPDEHCAVDDIVASAKVMALALLRLVG